MKKKLNLNRRKLKIMISILVQDLIMLRPQITNKIVVGSEILILEGLPIKKKIKEIKFLKLKDLTLEDLVILKNLPKPKNPHNKKIKEVI